MKKAFSIVELLLVIGILAVLLGIVTTAASKTIKSARAHRASAVCHLVQAGLAAYHAQHDEWPIDFRMKGIDRNSEAYELTAADVRTCVKALVEAAKKGTPLMDVSGLWVSRKSGERCSERAVGMSFMDAIHGTKKSKDKLKVSQMYFGYPDAATGYFLRFKMVYSPSADHLSVMQWPEGERR